MKKYLNYIFEGKIDELKVKYKDKVPEEIFNYFVSNMVKKISGAGSVLLEIMLKYYVDNKDNKKYEKVDLEKFIFELVRLFQQRKDNLHIKDITQLKTLDSLKSIITKKYDNIENKWSLGLYYDGEEYIIFSPLDFDTAYEYGDHAWCINREPKYFYGDEYRASYGGVIQCISKINSSKNLAIQIDNINSIWGYDYVKIPLEITIWDANDDSIYDGTYDNFKHDSDEKWLSLSKWCEKYGITTIKEILDVLDEIEKNGIDADTYIGDSLDNMWYDFSPNFDETLEWSIKNKKVNNLLYYIIHEGDSNIYNVVSDMFLANENNINKQIVVDVLSMNLDANFYIKKYDLNIDTNKKSPREIWQQIYDMIGVEEVIKLMQKTGTDQDYIQHIVKSKKSKSSKQLKMFEHRNANKQAFIEDFAALLDEETSKIYLEYLGELVDLDTVDYSNFVDLDINNKFEDWKTFKKMLRY